MLGGGTSYRTTITNPVDDSCKINCLFPLILATRKPLRLTIQLAAVPDTGSVDVRRVTTSPGCWDGETLSVAEAGSEAVPFTTIELFVVQLSVEPEPKTSPFLKVTELSTIVIVPLL